MSTTTIGQYFVQLAHNQNLLQGKQKASVCTKVMTMQAHKIKTATASTCDYVNDYE